MSSEQLFYEIIVTDKFGKVVAREHREAHSYLKAYNQMILCVMSNIDQTIKSTDGTDLLAHATYPWNLSLKISAAYGIVVGSGNTAVDISDYKLETRIADGTGAGQLSHQAMVIGIPTVGVAESAFTARRVFINATGGDVTVWELGMYAYMRDIAPAACIARDVLGGAAVVPSGGAITVIYTVKAVE